MHIAFWSPAWPLEKFQNGIITYVHWMKQALESLGHRVSVFTENLDQSVKEPHVYHVQQPRYGLWTRAIRRVPGLSTPSEYDVFRFSTSISTEILKVHRRDPIDVIEMEESFGWFADVARLTSLPLVVKLHGPAFLSLVEEELDTSHGQEKIRREGLALRSSKAIVSPSKLTLAQTIERYQLNPIETQHIVNPVAENGDTPLWRMAACDRNRILFVGRFDLRKGADIVLRAFFLMWKTHPELKLGFVGPDYGLAVANGRRMHFEPYCEAHFAPEFRKRIDFYGALPNHEVAKLRTQALVTVVASRWENQGYNVLEAMLQGCPVVSTDAGGCPENVHDGITGRLARSGDADDFASKLSSILQNPHSGEAMGKAARRYVIEQHSAARVATASLEMYERVIGRR